ncbi:hypothetical protein TNCV_4966881 [Trichonephila clavipes]|nr:hypothetical protein TNCV_4966881 [Trichonephila clavipes]
MFVISPCGNHDQSCTKDFLSLSMVVGAGLRVAIKRSSSTHTPSMVLRRRCCPFVTLARLEDQCSYLCELFPTEWTPHFSKPGGPNSRLPPAIDQSRVLQLSAIFWPHLDVDN